jgi:hypothetical protein
MLFVARPFQGRIARLKASRYEAPCEKNRKLRKKILESELEIDYI